MAAKRRGGSPRQHVKGFRPGKEPKHLKKQMAKAQLGKDASWAQKAAVDAVAGRSPKEVEAMVRKWSLGLNAGGLVLAVIGVLLYGWSVPAGIVFHVAAAALFFFGFRLKRQSAGLVEMADHL